MSASTDSRSAYRLKPPTYNAKLTEVARGAPMGELLRRYWHPVGLSASHGSARDDGKLEVSAHRLSHRRESIAR
jgi:hypothetical protein